MGYDIRDDISKSFSRENISILEMNIKKATLEQVFIELTSEADNNPESGIGSSPAIAPKEGKKSSSGQTSSPGADLNNNNDKNEGEEITDESNI